MPNLSDQIAFIVPHDGGVHFVYLKDGRILRINPVNGAILGQGNLSIPPK